MLSGDVARKVTVEGIGVSKGAKEAIEKAGGKVVEAAPAEKAKPAKKAKAEAAPAKEEAPAAEAAPAEDAAEDKE